MNSKLNTSFTNITTWNKRNFVNTGGTRAKFVALNEKGEMYYFKGAKETKEGGIRYPLEFWSEIISSKIGQLLGFNMLDYNIGYDNNHLQKIGCLSKSMIDEENERLAEGVTYLRGFAPDYQPDKDKKRYTFQFIKDTLNHHNIDWHLNDIIDTIIFDAIVGNSDRHQENWGFIRKYIKVSIDRQTAKRLNLITKTTFRDKIKSFFNKIFLSFNSDDDLSFKNLQFEVNIDFRNTTKFSPIYDSGCCLAREKSEQEIIKMNNDLEIVKSYINKGKSEIHWNEVKISHFQLIENLLIDYEKRVKERLYIVKKNYDADLIKDLIINIDNNLPDFCNDFKLTQERKEVIIKIVNLRIQKVLSLI